jgi:glutamate racemase
MTAAAFEEALTRYQLPIVAVIAPAVRAGAVASRNGKIGVIGTKVTVASGEYERELKALDPSLEVYSQICPAFVERVEAGDTFSAELIELAEGYLDPLIRSGVDTILLGCTHYPMLRGVLHWVTKGKIVLISSAEEVAKDVYSGLVERGMLRQVTEVGSRRYMVSGDPDQFRLVGSRFMPGIDEVEVQKWASK